MYFAHDVRFVIFIFFQENNQKKTMDDRILSKKSPSLFLTTFRKKIYRQQKYENFQVLNES